MLRTSMEVPVSQFVQTKNNYTKIEFHNGSFELHETLIWSLKSQV